jgi:hypothetical protein
MPEEMTNDEARMTKQARMTNGELNCAVLVQMAGSSFDIRH